MYVRTYHTQVPHTAPLFVLRPMFETALLIITPLSLGRHFVINSPKVEA